MDSPALSPDSAYETLKTQYCPIESDKLVTPNGVMTKASSRYETAPEVRTTVRRPKRENEVRSKNSSPPMTPKDDKRRLTFISTEESSDRDEVKTNGSSPQGSSRRKKSRGRQTKKTKKGAQAEDPFDKNEAKQED